MPVSAPPDVPPGLDARTTAYLRRLSVWAYGELQKEMPKNEASPAVMLQSPNGSVYRITVDDSGKLVSTPVALGSGEGGTAMTFAPITVSGMEQKANPAGTTSTSYVMMGMGLVLREAAPALTPEFATRAWVTFNGRIANDTNGRETDVVVCYGTGTSPANGDPQTGAIITQPAAFIATSGGGSFAPFSLTAVIAGLAPGTPYWFDLAVKVTGGTGTVSDVDGSAMGLP